MDFKIFPLIIVCIKKVISVIEKIEWGESEVPSVIACCKSEFEWAFFEEGLIDQDTFK